MTETHRTTSGTVDVGDAHLHYEERGTGEPVLLLHAGGYGDWFAPVLDEPALDGLRLIRPHRAGYGRSSTPERHVTLADHARHAATLLRELGVERAHWVGHSSSGSIALQAALDSPDAVTSLVLLDPAPTPAGPSAAELVRTVVGPAMGAAQAGDVEGAARTFLAGVCGPDLEATLRARLGDDAGARLMRDQRFFIGDEVLAAREWAFDASAAARVEAPVRLAYGADGWRHTRAHQETTEILAGWLPNAQLTAIPGVGHGMPIEDPAAVAALIAEAVGSVRAST